MCGVYIHIPFCRRKCFYCDFYSVGSRNAPWKAYAAAITAEAAARAEEFIRCKISGTIGSSSLHPTDAHMTKYSSDTLYIGGGTPSQMPIDLLCGLIGDVTDKFVGFSPIETTVEVNPEDVSTDLCLKLAEAGVNRVSMGIQSLNDRELKAVGRTHTSAQALKAYETLRRHFDNISIDLIFGLPLQTQSSWEASLSRAIELDAAHISAYSLMWEERTALYKMQQTGKVSECEEDISDSMYLSLVQSLGEAGYEHYEISNFAKPGFRSVHNSSYWVGTPYIGLGAAAHSYNGERIRRANPADVKRYIAHYQQSTIPLYTEEQLTDEELHEEYIMTRLRRREGIDTADYRVRFGEHALRVLLNKAKCNPALLRITPQSITLTRESVMRSDSAILALL